jgi:hypothetical protein
VGSPTGRLQLQIDLDTVHDQVDVGGARSLGLGDLYLETQYSTGNELPYRASLALAYRVKAPTADTDGGSGRFDHRITGLLSWKRERTDVDLNASLLVNGRSGATQWQTGAQGAVGVSRELADGLSLQVDLFGETLDSDEPRGLFLQGGIAAALSERVSLDSSVRVGLNPGAPRWGVQGGLVVLVRR